jgi:hypothetical protein
MSPRIIHIPLSGGDRKPQAKRAYGTRTGSTPATYRESILIRSAAEAKIREADRLAKPGTRSRAGGPAMPSPGGPQRSRRLRRPSTAASICWRPKCIVLNPQMLGHPLMFRS